MQKPIHGLKVIQKILKIGFITIEKMSKQTVSYVT